MMNRLIKGKGETEKRTPRFPLLRVFFSILVLNGFLFSASCRDEVVLNRPEDYADWTNSTNTWSFIFEGFWTGMNNNYVFWDIDPTDWDAVHALYKPAFAALDAAPGGFSFNYDALKQTAWDCFRGMTAFLVDGHYAMQINGISIGINPSAERHFMRYGVSYYGGPSAWGNMAATEIFAEGDYNFFMKTPNTVFQTAAENSFKKDASADYVSLDFTINGDKTDIVRGIRRSGGGAILYLRFNHFNWQSMYDYRDAGKLRALNAAIDQWEQAMNTTDTAVYLDFIDDDSDPDSLYGRFYAALNSSVPSGEDLRFVLIVRTAIFEQEALFRQLQNGRLDDGTPVKGAVFDVRGNGGGLLVDLSRLWGRLIAGEHTFARVRTKLGDNRRDFSPWMDLKIYAPEGSKPVALPLVLLTNEFSVSCAEFSAMIFKSLPSACVAGGRTWGGQGFIADNRIYNAGKFSVGIGNIVVVDPTPSGQVQYLDGHIYENQGLPPDIPVPFDYAALQAGRDIRLERALAIIEGR